MSDEDASKLSKDDMYKVLYERIVNNAEEAESGQKKSNAQSEKMCWNCGYWLSFMAKITEQIEYLGVLRLIWLVVCCKTQCVACNIIQNLLFIVNAGRADMKDR